MLQGMKYVYAVYTYKNFSKAADHLFISQPALSANVKREEDVWGYPIFDRSIKPLGLTEFGEKYIETVEKIMNIEASFEKYVSDLNELKTGKLILGGSALYASYVLPELMADFSKKYPLVTLELHEDRTSTLEKLLHSGEIDFLMDNIELDDLNYEKKIYQKEYLLLAVPATFPINDHLQQFRIPVEKIIDHSFLDESIPVIDIRCFKNEPFIMLKKENNTGKLAIHLCKKYHFEPQILFEIDQQMTSYNITCSQMGISLISDTLITKVPDTHQICYYKLDTSIVERNLNLYYKRGRYMSKIMQKFIEQLK